MSVNLPDQALATSPLMTKRLVIAQVSVCQGCCCGNTARGKPEVPIDRMKQEWRSQGLSKVVQLTVSGCFGPCDLVNVVRISSAEGDLWFGNFRSLDDYFELVNWAVQSRVIGRPAPLSKRMAQARFDPFDKLAGDLGRASLPDIKQSEEKDTL